MKRADIRIGDAKDFEEPVTVREGRIQVELGTNFGPLTSGKAVGELIFADRVYGPFTQAYTRGGDFIPVCLEMVEQYGVRGIRRKGRRPRPGDEEAIGDEPKCNGRTPKTPEQAAREKGEKFTPDKNSARPL